MNKKKKIGSYYTPEFLADFVMVYVAGCFSGRTKLSILEPSAGDGSFLRSFNKTEFPKSIIDFSFQAVEKFKPELHKAEVQANINRKPNVRFSFEKNDFLKYQYRINRKFSFIVGNPPYIKKSFLNKTQIELCESIHANANLSTNSVKNIWSYFLIRSCELLTDDGILAFILPAELLQVNFSIELRQYLIVNFERTEIFTFDDLLFECKGQDTVLLIAYKKHKKKGQYFTHISNVEQLQTNNFILTKNTALETSKIKWTHHTLSSDELTFIYKLSDRLKTINDYCDSKPGIVTAGNRFFIVNKETELKYALTNYVLPVIQKGFFVNGSVVFDRKEFDDLVANGKPSKVLAISDAQVDNLPPSVCAYLEIGANEDFSSGYKCSKRKHWFVVPNIASPSDGFFFRRVHNYPKLLVNEANVLVTDTAYKIDMNKGYNIHNLIYSFYNSLTLAFAELFGRYFGGGVLELTPNEFKRLPVPYQEIQIEKFDVFRNSFENKSSIEDVLFENDRTILYESMGLSLDEIELIKNIYTKLITKRLRK